MSNLQNDILKEKLIEVFDQWFEDNSGDFYSDWSEGDYRAHAAWQDGDESYFEDKIMDLYIEIEEVFFGLDESNFDIQSLYEAI